MKGKLISTKNFEEINLDGSEKLSLSKFLNEKSEETVNLGQILGIGGEGIVLSQKMDISESHFKRGLEEKRGRDVAIKFVKFEKRDDEDFLNGNRVESQYFERLLALGDYKAATHDDGGYSRPYIDFGISEIHQKNY